MENAGETMQTAIDQAITLITEYGLDVVGAIVILVLGLIVSGWVSRAVRSGLSRVSSRPDLLLPCSMSVESASRPSACERLMSRIA